MTLFKNDLDRLRHEYAQRSYRGTDKERYSFFNKSYLYTVQQRQRYLLALLYKTGYCPLTDKKILEIGCGNGRVLLEFLQYGISPSNLHGIDLLPDRLYQAQEHIGDVAVFCADGQNLPFPTNTYDLILQFTAFSSILDDTIKKNMATDMLRVLKPTGAILWYDFWLNPTNPHTKGIRQSEVKALFPQCNYTFRKITLAPPITRRLVPFSWTISFLIENLRVVNTHYLAVITPVVNP